MTARAALAVVLALLALPAAAPAAPSFLGDDARVFTLAGGGTETPRDGLPANRADLGPGSLRGLAALPDGAVAVLTGDAVALAVAGDGRVRMLPRPPRGASQLAAGPDGSLYTVTMRQLLRLAPGAGAWAEAHDLAAVRGRPGRVEVRSFAVLPDGFVFAFGNGTMLRVGAAGATEELAVPRGYLPRTVTAIPEGGFAFTAVDDFAETDEVVVVVPASGPSRMLSDEPLQFVTMDFVALPGGTFARTRPPLEVLDAGGHVTGRVGWRPRLGLGDGGPPALALLGAAKEIARVPDGSLVVEDLVAPHDAPIDAIASRPRGATLLTSPSERDDGTPVLRVLAPVGTTRPLAAVAPSTFATLAEGRVGYVTTFAGRATVEVRRHGRVVARVEADVAAGVGELTLPGAPPRGDLRVDVGIVGEAGTAGARIAVATAQRLTDRRARRLIGRVTSPGEDFGLRRGRCVRAGALRIRCRAYFFATGSGDEYRQRCTGVFDVRLRADGARLLLQADERGSNRACRALGR